MLIREKRRLRLALVLGTALILLLLCVRLTGAGPALSDVLLGGGGGRGHWLFSSSGSASHSVSASSYYQGVLASYYQESVSRPPGSGTKLIGAYGEIAGFAPPNDVRPGGAHPLHTEIFSVTTRDRKYFRIQFGSQEDSIINPNIVPHPRADNLWLTVAQRRGKDQAEPSVELVCDAMFIDDTLRCIDEDGRGFGEPSHLPVVPTIGDASKCTGDQAVYNSNIGPQEAKVSYGPKGPYILYGSNSKLTCFSQWIQDLRGLVIGWTGKNGAVSKDPSSSSSSSSVDLGTSSTQETFTFTSRNGTELQKPSPYNPVETNWFLFWDIAGKPYIHYSLTPRRSFAQLDEAHSDLGAVSKDMASKSAKQDQQCIKTYWWPLLDPNTETIYQATNSLAITLCRRADTTCTPDEKNTFLFAIFQHRTELEGHITYHPYAAVFRQRAPFELWAIGSRPIWISGRATFPNGDTESLKATSMNWRGKGQRYHGYADDVLFLTFSIEGERSGGIDVQAGELLANLGLC